MISNFEPIKDCSTNEPNYCTIKDITDLKWVTVTGKCDSISSKHSLSFLHPRNVLATGTETTVETQTLYFTDFVSGKCGFVQLLYSSVLNHLYKSVQLNLKLFNCRGEDTSSDCWEKFKIGSAHFTDYKVECEHLSFELKPTQGDRIGTLAIKASDLKSHTGKLLTIDLEASLQAGFKIKPDGSSFYLDKNKKMMRHVFVPQATCSGSIQISDNNTCSTLALDKSPGLFVGAIQGLNPSKAARSWNFACFQSPEMGAVCMEYTTTASYGSTTVTVGGVSRSGVIEAVYASSSPEAQNHVTFLDTALDQQNGLSYPTAISIPLSGPKSCLQLGPMRMVNKYDILGELPGIIRKVVQNIAGVNPYLYQYCQEASFSGQEGIAIAESTFIST